MKTIQSKFKFTDMILFYILNEEKQMEMLLVPSDMEQNIVWDKPGKVDSLVQLMIDGDAAPYGFLNGHSFRNASSAMELEYVEQMVEREDRIITITTILKNKRNLYISHQVTFQEGNQGITVRTAMENKGEEELTINMLSSFSLGMLTPFVKGEATHRLLIHRIRSKWSTEGRVETRTAEEMLLEPTWSRHGAFSEKFGQLGSMPVRNYFPILAIEDKGNKTIWAAQLCCASSWQMEIYRRDENLCISGGIADYDFGHWCKTLKQKERFVSPEAFLTVSRGDFDGTCQRLVRMQASGEEHPEFTDQLPVIFNEYCTTWGEPSQDRIGSLLKVLRDKGADYFVIDAGWYADAKKGWENNMGDWNVSQRLFPDGIAAAVNAIKTAGLKPGIWFEAEVVGQEANVLLLYPEHLLTKKGKIICSGSRYFWDMRDPWTQNYLSEKIIGFLKENQFEYIKIDYNETIGIGCDGAESLGQGLYDTIEATKLFFRKIRSEIPGIVIEICASGGHRLEPSMVSIADMVSFSDAHEEPEIPVIAANMHRVIPPHKSQIWAVIRKEDTLQRICYSMSAAFLGVMCISGDMNELSDPQWKLIDKGMAFYRKISSILQNGISEYYGTGQGSYRVLEGWQGILRLEESGNAYLVLHSFENTGKISIPIPTEYEVLEVYESGPHTIRNMGKCLEIDSMTAYEAVAILLRRLDSSLTRTYR